MQAHDFKKAVFWRAIIANFIVDIGVVTAFAVYLNYSDGTSILESALILLAILWVAAIVIGIRSFLGTMVLSKLTDQDFIKSAALHDLRLAKLPHPRRYNSKNLEYLAELADDEAADVADRMKASAMYANAKISAKNAGFSRGMIIEMGFDKAVMQYYDEGPRE